MDFLDFKPSTHKCLPVNPVDVTGAKVQWMKVKWFQYRKREPDSIFFKYEFNEETFHKLNIKSCTTKSSTTTAINQEMPKRYAEKLPISDMKKKDLLSLCKEGIIPAECHGFYESLPSNRSVRDKLPAPDALEEDKDSDGE